MVQNMQTETMLDEIERTSQLDAPADFLLDKVGKSLAKGPFGDVLKGKWLGHPLHPVLTDIPIGFWTSGMVLDFLAPKAGRKAAQRLIGLGTLSAIPAALAGLTDASSIEDPAERRVAAAHAIGNGTATLMFGLSWRARHKGHHARGVLWSLMGGTVATGAGLLGGNLAFGRSKTS
jgi:uncharacterized membrane protein